MKERRHHPRARTIDQGTVLPCLEEEEAVNQHVVAGGIQWARGAALGCRCCNTGGRGGGGVETLLVRSGAQKSLALLASQTSILPYCSSLAAQ